MLLLYIDTDAVYVAISGLTLKDIIEELFGGTGRGKLSFFIFSLAMVLPQKACNVR